MYRNSGKDYNDLGRMDDCEAQDGFNYLLMTFETDEKLPIPLGLGLCVPTICKEADLNEFLPIFLPPLNNKLPDIFKDVKGLNMTAL